MYNDLTGEFIAADALQAVTAASDGSWILMEGDRALSSPLKPRELLRRLTIIRFHRENGKSTETRSNSQATTSMSA